MLYRRQISNHFHLCEAIQRRDKIKARDLIHNGVDVNLNVKGNTPLHWAIIKFDDLDIVTMLLDKGANIHAKDNNNYTPLDIAIQYNKMKAALLLIEKGVFVGKDLTSFLLTAIVQNNHTMFEMLIDRGMQYNPSIDFKTLINAAVSQGRQKMLEHIISDCRFLESHQYIPKELVMKSGLQYKECVELLMKRNFIINPDHYHDEDLIYGAIENGHLQIFLQLLNSGVDVNMVNANTGLNLLTIACLNRHHKIVEHLLQHGADVNVTMTSTNERLNNKPHFYRNIRVFKNLLLLLDKKDDWCDITCLHIAVFNYDSSTIKILLKYGVKIRNDPTFFNITYTAVRLNCEAIVRIFLDHGVDVTDINPQGKLLLRICLHSDSSKKDSTYNVVKLLLNKGANIHLQTPSNTFVFDAINNGHRKIAQLFLEHNADVHYISLDGDTLLHKAIEKGFDPKFITTLLKLNLPVDAKNVEGFTPLHVAVKQKHLTVIKSLIKYGADVNSLDKNNQTPLVKAAMEKSTGFRSVNKEMIKMLKTQVVKLKAAKLEVNNQNLDIVYNSNDLGEDYHIYIQQIKIECRLEIEKMRTECIGVNNITFHDLLKKNIHFLCRFVENEKFQNILETEVYDLMFPLYIDIVRNRFREAKVRYKLMNTAKEYFRLIINSQLPDECIDIVFSYLNIRELNKFIEALKPLND